MIPCEYRQATFPFSLKLLISIVRVLLVAAFGLMGCASPASSGSPSPTPEMAAPLPSALYSDLREERPLDPARLARQGPGGDRHEAFVKKMGRLIGRTVRDPCPSPNGERIVFIVTRESRDKLGRIWIARADGSLPYLLTAGLGRARRTVWRNDGTPEGRIYFSSGGRVWSFRPVLLDRVETES